MRVVKAGATGGRLSRFEDEGHHVGHGGYYRVSRSPSGSHSPFHGVRRGNRGHSYGRSHGHRQSHGCGGGHVVQQAMPVMQAPIVQQQQFMTTMSCGSGCDCCCSCSDEEYVMYEPVLIERKVEVEKKVVKAEPEVMAVAEREPVERAMWEPMIAHSHEPLGEEPEVEIVPIIAAKGKKVKNRATCGIQTDAIPDGTFNHTHIVMCPHEPLAEEEEIRARPDRVHIIHAPMEIRVEKIIERVVEVEKPVEVQAALPEPEVEEEYQVAYIERPVERECHCRPVQVQVPVTTMQTQ